MFSFVHKSLFEFLRPILKGYGITLELIKKIKTGVSSYVHNTDWLLTLSCLAASIYGIILIYSAAHTAGSGPSDYIIQIIAVLIGLLAALIISRVDYEVICRLWPIWTGISLFLVILTLTPLGLTVYNNKAWLLLPYGGGRYLSLQPSELLKIAFIITFSTHLTKVRDKLNEFKTVLLLGLHACIPIGLIFLQGDNGTALVFICIFVAMIIAAGLRAVYILIAAIGGTAMVPLVWHFMPDDKKARFLCLIFVDQYPDISYQQTEGLNNIGSGQLWGVGFMKGNYFYARNNDFIFTVAGEEFGFIGAVLLLVVLLLIVFALLREVMTARDLQGMLLCSGIMAEVGFQSLINIGMTLRVLPVVGITLPFFSRGGSSVTTLFLGIGIALSVYNSSRTRIRNTIFAKKTY